MRTTRAQLELIILDHTHQFEEQRLVVIELQHQLAIANARLTMFRAPASNTLTNNRRAAMQRAREAAILGKRTVLAT